MRQQHQWQLRSDEEKNVDSWLHRKKASKRNEMQLKFAIPACSGAAKSFLATSRVSRNNILMDEDPLKSERPPNESWWERELHRNEKLMDKYMAVLGDNPADWDKWQDPDDLYNKVHFGIDPAPKEKPEPPADAEEPENEAEENDTITDASDAEADAVEGEEWEDPDEDPEVNENYEATATHARRFAGRVFDLEKVPGNGELLFLSAGRVGANLAGGHGLGYDDETICGNVVKCRWALSDCEFCREMLEQLHSNTGEPRYGELAVEAAQLAETIRERIARLRKRVWW
jgi:hypothetical protein